MTNVYSCTVWRDRRRPFAAKLVEQFETALDPDDPRSLQHALAAAASRDRGNRADLATYSLQVCERDGKEVIKNYRHTAWLDEEAGEGDTGE